MIARSLLAIHQFAAFSKRSFRLSRQFNSHVPDLTRHSPATSTSTMFSYLNPLPQLSKYTGPYRVGSAEFEIPVSELQSSTVIPDPQVTTIKFRVFYPSTSSAKSKKSIPWLPTPQRVWKQGYANFFGVGDSKASWMSYLPSILDHVTIPAVQNATLLDSSVSKPYPVMVFSHGLGGNYNTYSSVVGSVASCGVICVVPEHRDGSAPVSVIKSSPQKIEKIIPYQKYAHSPTVEVLNGRNAMLRVRLWELELVFSAISSMNEGKNFTNYADTVSKTSGPPDFSGALDLKPGKVTWAGHSFGSATIVQFVKSIYYNDYAPKLEAGLDKEGWNMTPLYTPSIDGDLIQQITPESPVALLDLWTMPLRGATTSWLWDRPLPCYHRKSTEASPNVISIMSAEFYKWPELRNRARAVLSADPNEALVTYQNSTSPTSTATVHDNSPDPIATTIASKLPSSKVPEKAPAEEDLDEPAEPELKPIPSTADIEAVSQTSNTPSDAGTRTPSPARSSTSVSRNDSASSSVSSLLSTTSTKPQPSKSPAHLYLIPNSAHLSQSDFGPLFPNLTRYFMKALEPEKTVDMNVRAILATMKGRGLDVRDLHEGNKNQVAMERILEGDGIEGERWERVQL